ncbi:Crp/Fnr family transcriptional regulator [Rhodoferax lacus]|uniref:Crp/Fnr family transcriptional regulator n=1 Tax=Rhodoferax lacus TaxID=2184758 RepID=A0A3E1REL3_9BURK|nr:Crp/Fnr family transcriptional regulator [Rhodoferax lacus]RFO97808.1 Crp/Fnr family transcriptional regulator [Rhodoferax lacus]
MPASQYAFIADYPTQSVPPGAVLLRRSVPAGGALFIESGRVALGVVAAESTLADADGHATPVMDHQLGMVEGPAWLEANAAVLNLPSAVDAVAETSVVLRSVPLEAFRLALSGGSAAALAVLTDMARAHRQQMELAVSRLSKDAEARCAEWLLRHAESSDKGVCSVKLQLRKRLIAAQLGIAPETLSRVLRHLRERSLISGSGRIVNLVDPGGLRSLAGV